MTELSVEGGIRPPHDLPMEDRVARLEEDMRDVKSVLSRLEPMIVRIDATLTSTLPNLATKAEVADLRTEVTKEIADLRTEVTKEIAEVRTELSKEIVDLRLAMIQRFADVPTKTYLWGILGVPIITYGAGLAALAVIK
ncbi:MAG: hypothetical protein ACJ8AW_36050 [Rhodopila sp.]